MNEILEARSQSAIRKVRDAIVATDTQKMKAAPKVDRVYAPTVSSEEFKSIIKDLYGTDATEIPAKAEGSKSSQFPTFVFKVDGSDIGIVLAKGVIRGAEGESKEVGSIQEKLRSIGGEEGVSIAVAGKLYKGIKTIERVSGNKKADFVLSGTGGSIFVQHKSPTHQQMAGIAKPPYSNHPEVKTFVEDVRQLVARDGRLIKPYAKAIQSDELKQLATYGTVDGKFDSNTVQLYCVGELDLIPGDTEGVYKLVGKTETYEYPTIPDGVNEPMLGATYRKGRNQSGIPDVRLGIYPKNYLRVS